MGYTTYSNHSDTLLRNRNTDRVAGVAPAFAYNADVQSGKVAAKVHDQLNPRGATRESRDSDVHPNSVPIAVYFDVTGSMHGVPRVFQQRLPGLMSLLALRGYIADPQIQFGAIGDAISDRGPLQVGQFESSLEMDDDLERMWLEGGGGGSAHESYELAHYFVARHVVSDAWEKRQRKGYLFTMGDEAFYPTIEPSRVRGLIGDNLMEAISTPSIVQELQERWHVFHLHVQEGSYRDNADILGVWRGLLGEDHVLLLERGSQVADMIGLVIGLTEGTVTVAQAETDLTQLGYDAADAHALVESLGHVAARAIRLRDEATA